MDHTAETKRFPRGVVLSVIASAGLALITLACLKLRLNVTTTVLLYVIVIVLTSRAGNFASSIFTSILATLCLAYLVPPNYSFRVNDPLDVVGIIAFLITSLVIARLVSRLHEMMNEARSSVSRKLLDAEERERTRIGRELHDDINQRLALLAVGLEGLKRSIPTGATELGDRLGDASRQVQNLATDVQALSHRLHTSKLDIAGLAAAARSFCGEFADQQKVEVDFHSDNIPKELEPNVSICLFRVLQEALQNASKHSGSRHYKVSLMMSGANQIELTVHDSGIGFEPEEAIKGHGLGLTSMRERLKLVDGQFSIDSRPQGGTTLHALVPISPK
jgi:signal transduction histidine kinase